MAGVIRLAFGVVAGKGQAVWDARGRVVRDGLPEGTPVVLGPEHGDGQAAARELARLVAEGGVVAAGAGVELRPGFRSARLEGARGDRRDAVLAALRVLGVDGIERLGERAGVLVALFGAGATKPVAAAASRAIAEGRWADLDLASAASDLLEPEQLERLLTTPTAPRQPERLPVAPAVLERLPVAPADLERLPADLGQPERLPATPADPGHLDAAVADRGQGDGLLGGPRQVDGILDGPGQGDGLLDGAGEGDGLHVAVGGIDQAGHRGPASAVAENLGRVLEGFPAKRRLELLLDLRGRVAAAQARNRRTEKLTAVRSRLEDVRRRYSDHADEQLIARVRAELGHEPTLGEAARWVPPPWYWAQAAHRVMCDAQAATVLLRAAVAVAEYGTQAGLERCAAQLTAAAPLMGDGEAGWAARRVPGLAGVPARPGCYVRDLARRLGDTPEPFAAQRLARAEDYGTVVLAAATERIAVAHRYLHDWAKGTLSDWRAAVGHTEVRQPSTWLQPPVGGGEPLANRAPEEETAGDLLWLADLADALAQLHGAEAAVAHYGDPTPYFLYHPDDPDPLDPRYDTIALAVAGTAQLASYGGRVSRRCRTWAELVRELAASAHVSEALTGTFRLPAALAEADGLPLPGTDLRVECARGGRLLAEWASYMGNCIAGEYYVSGATRGDFGLVALRAPDGRIVANLELRPGTRGWRVEEFRARFNDDPPPEVAEAVTRWVGSLRPAVPEQEPPDEPSPSPRAPGTRRPGRLFREIAEPLARQVARAMAAPETERALRTLQRAHNLTALRRMPAERLGRAFQDTPLAELWAATGIRPLRAVLDNLDLTVRLAPLLADAPLPSSMRRLARHPDVAAARSMELVARRIRWTIGTPSHLRGAGTQVLCALVIAATARGEGTPITVPGETAVPGYPASDLADPAGPWQQALDGAVELGADLDAFWERVLESGLLVPETWLDGGWPTLWSRATHQDRHPTHP
ncbi:hypothetical protein ACIBHX_00620 [Nonomuraea sp. NPDC050536]|uniref:hypothetical protein n=1 Tax=Nonomuraea sp. NPDC050536 TaxID=3364366 RepID=UPI0037C69B87